MTASDDPHHHHQYLPNANQYGIDDLPQLGARRTEISWYLKNHHMVSRFTLIMISSCLSTVNISIGSSSLSCSYLWWSECYLFYRDDLRCYWTRVGLIPFVVLLILLISMFMAVYQRTTPCKDVPRMFATLQLLWVFLIGVIEAIWYSTIVPLTRECICNN
jgi:hypothetical protein